MNSPVKSRSRSFVSTFLDVDETKEKVGEIEKTLSIYNETRDRVKEIGGTLTKLQKDVAVLKDFKTSTEKFFIDSKIYAEKSPLSLTDLGNELLEESGLKTILEEEDVQQHLLQMLEEKNPETRYDAQEMARSLMDSLTKYEKFKHIKEYAFDHGKDFQQILRAGSIPLRDLYIEKKFNKENRLHSKTSA